MMQILTFGPIVNTTSHDIVLNFRMQILSLLLVIASSGYTFLITSNVSKMTRLKNLSQFSNNLIYMKMFLLKMQGLISEYQV